MQNTLGSKYLDDAHQSPHCSELNFISWYKQTLSSNTLARWECVCMGGGGGLVFFWLVVFFCGGGEAVVGGKKIICSEDRRFIMFSFYTIL